MAARIHSVDSQILNDCSITAQDLRRVNLLQIWPMQKIEQVDPEPEHRSDRSPRAHPPGIPKYSPEFTAGCLNTNNKS